MSLSFSGGMPLITILCFLAIALRYFFEKFYFFRYCRVPKMFDEALDLKVTSLIPYAILIHFCFSIWMYGANSVFENDATTFSSEVLFVLVRRPTAQTASSRAFTSSFKDC